MDSQLQQQIQQGKKLKKAQTNDKSAPNLKLAVNENPAPSEIGLKLQLNSALQNISSKPSPKPEVKPEPKAAPKTEPKAEPKATALPKVEAKSGLQSKESKAPIKASNSFQKGEENGNNRSSKALNIPSVIEISDRPLTLAERLVWEIVPERHIRIGNPEVVGSWIKQHTTYLIYDDKTGAKVRRRFNDFVWLKEVLEKLLPFTFLPPLPDKQHFGRFEEAFIFSRQKALQRFLNRLNENPKVQNHQAFVTFMSEQDEDRFNESKKEYQKISKTTKSVSKFSTDPFSEALEAEISSYSLTHDISIIRPLKFSYMQKKLSIQFQKRIGSNE